MVTKTEARRAREVQFLFVGHEIRNAISHYYRSNGGRDPQSLQELVQDDSAPKALHHLRKLYLDPMTGSSDRILLRALDGGIYDVYSSSTAAPRKKANFDLEDAGFEEATCYQGWRFSYVTRNRRMLAVPPTDDRPSP